MQNGNLHEPSHYSKPDFVKEKPNGETLADYFTFFLERDVLGPISNLHLALSDKLGKQGPADPKCIKLAQLASIAVDFAKHGECVAKSEYKDLELELKEWPDFFEKPNRDCYESDGILGVLYRSLDSKPVADLFQRQEY